MPITFSRPTRITSSRGNSENPKVASDSLGNIFVAFQDDRVRQYFPDVYLSKFDSSTGDWLSSNNSYEDIKFENYVTKATKPAVAFDTVGNVAVVCETEKDGSQSQVQLSVYDGSLITIDENAAAIFPFNDAEGTTTVKNQRRTFRRAADGSVVTLHIDAVSSKNASDLSDNTSVSDAISLANPADLKALKFNTDDEWVKIQTSLLKPSGGIDFWMKPILASSDTTTKYFVGNTSLALDPINSFCFMSDNGDLKFKIVDEIGKVHLVTVDSLDYSWAAEEWVHVRLTWDERGKGVTRNTGVSFPSSSIGYVSSLSGGIFKTTDSGTTWVRQNSTTDFDLHAIDFISNTIGFACGENGLFLKTDDGGANWQSIDTGFSEDILALVAADSNKIAIAGSEGLIAITIDGGTTWTRATLDVATDGQFNAITIVPAGIDWRIIAVGQGGQIYRSTGTVSFSSSFEQMTSPTEEDLFGLSRSHPPGIPATAWTVYAVGAKSTILVSTNKGTTFSASQIEFEGSYPDLLTVAHESNQDNVYAAGSNGFTARSLDGALSWATAPSAFNDGDIYGLDASYAATEFSAVGSSGAFLRATGSGDNQVYTTTFSGNMNILINGKLPTQVRTGDSEFRWNPEGQSFFYVGNFEPSVTATQTTTAQASFASVILYRMPPSIGSFTRRQLHTFQSVSLSVSADRDLRKRIEFGNISGLAKARSHWSQVRFFTCGSMEPYQTFSWNVLSGLVDDVINDMAIGDGGKLWIATENGVSCFDAKTASDEISRFVSGQKLYSNNNYRFISYGAESGLPTGSISCIATGSDGSIWVGTRSGIYVAFTDQGSTATANVDPLTKAAQTAANNASLGAFDRPAPRTFFKLSADDGSVPERILCVTRGKSAMFFGSEDGLYTLTPTGLRRFGVVDGLPSNRVQAVVQDNLGMIWIGTDRGVARYTPAGIVSYGLASANVMSLYAYKNLNIVLAGTLFGIIVIGDTEISRVIQTSGSATLKSIFDIDTDDAGRFWLATASGLTEIDPDCYTLPRRYDFEDGILGFPCLEEFKRYKILGSEIPASDYCDRALILVAVNGKVVNEGYKITLVPSSGDNLEHINYVEFDNPLQASDKVEVVVNTGIRKIADFDTIDGGLAVVVSEKTKFNLYKRLYTAGDVVLGGNRASGTTNKSAAMYGVFAVSTAGGAAIGEIDLPETSEYRSVVDKELGMYANEEEDPIVVLPNFLLSAEQIALSDDDQYSTSDSYLSFELTQSAIIYVAFDSRAKTLPEWLSDFEPVKATLRVNDLEVFEDAELDKLMIAVGGTNGCVYEAIASDYGICDISRSIAIDAEPPTGCATIITANSLESLSLSIEASDSVTGVSEMRVSSNQSFTDEDGNDLPWIPFQSSYTLTLPANTGSSTEDLVDLPEDISDVGGEFSVIALFGNRVLVGTSNPGNVYELNTETATLTLLFETGEDEVLSLVGFGEVLMVGTGTNGKAYTWTENDGLVQVSSGEDKVEAMIVFNNKVLIGTSPLAKIYQYDAAGNTSLFLNLGAGGSGDVGISGFAIHGSRLYITTYNDRVTVGETISTTTAKGHRHTIAVPSGASRLKDIGGVYTSEVATSAIAAHRHLSTAGELSTESSHTHILNGNRAGKVYEYDLANDLTKIVHADKDFSVSSIVSTSVSTADGLMFAGTSPNGKLIRFVPEESIFLLSFDTLASDVSSLIYGTDGKIYATANNVVYKFDGRRWLFIGAADGQVVGSVMINGIIYMLKTDGISIIKPDAVVADPEENESSGLTTRLCAFIQLRDAAGNATRVDMNPDCYNPCIEVDPNTGTPDDDDDDGNGGAVPKFKSHRLVEIDTDSNVKFSTNGSEAFFSGDKVQAEIGTYYSEVINGTNNLVQWVGITWSGTTPTGSEITLAVRTAATSAALATAEWSEEFTSSSGNDITNMLGQFLQFRATLKVTLAGGQSPELHYVDIEARVGQATHYYTTNFVLPDEFKKGILTYNGCINPPITDVVFGVSGLNTTDFADYFVVSPNRLFEVPEEHQTKNLRVAIKLISSPDSVPVVDEFALMFSLANNAFTRLMLPGQPGQTDGTPVYQGTTRTVVTEKVQGHTHTVTFDTTTSDISQINGKTSINAGHSHVIINGIIQEAAGHTHQFSIE